jgi:hypothetical protein
MRHSFPASPHTSVSCATERARARTHAHAHRQVGLELGAGDMDSAETTAATGDSDATVMPEAEELEKKRKVKKVVIKKVMVKKKRPLSQVRVPSLSIAHLWHASACSQNLEAAAIEAGAGEPGEEPEVVDLLLH